MTRIVFAITEIAPTTRGGAGNLLFHAARELLNRGHEIIFVLDIPADLFDQFQNKDRFLLPHPENCRAYHVDSITSDIDIVQSAFKSPAAWRSYRFHLACSHVTRIEEPDIIEFTDFLGVGHYALIMKVAGLDYFRTRILVRLHSSLELVDMSFSSAYEHFVYDLERSALQLAETILYPSSEYLFQEYRIIYPIWFGDLQESQPPLFWSIKRHKEDRSADVILFYGRLFLTKGVDIFVNAAVFMLILGYDVRFIIAGYDSYQPPDGSATYEQFLRKQIPQRYQSSFVFTGQISRDELERMLPYIRFAVFPSIYESFCYAVHELYVSGIPLILSNIPAFLSFFRHEENALIFDGTSADLLKNMIRLWEDHDLRLRLSFPYPVLDRPLGDVYDHPPRESWIQGKSQLEEPFSMLVGVVGSSESSDEDFRVTLKNLEHTYSHSIRVVFLRDYYPNYSNEDKAAWILGRMFCLTSPDGSSLSPVQIYTAQSLLFVRAGDIISPRFIQCSCDILSRQKQIGFVGCWRRTHTQLGEKIETFPFDASPELLPFLSRVMYQRFVLRTSPGRSLIDLFDRKMGALGEIAYIWSIESQGMRGIIIPEPMIECNDEPVFIPSKSNLGTLLLNDRSYWHQSRLARLNIWLEDYMNSLSSDNSSIKHCTYEQSSAYRLREIVGDNRMLRGVRRLLRQIASK